MEQQNNTTILNDSAGVLPMDTGVTYNGLHDEIIDSPSSSAKAGAKKGRGRPPKSTNTIKASSASDTPKRGRGRPPKTGETPSSKNKVTALKKKNEEISTNVDANKRKRGRPSKSSTSNEQINGISKPHVQVTPVLYQQEKQVVADEPTKRKRGRPSGSSQKKIVVAAVLTPSKEASPTRKRGRPSGSGSNKKSLPKPKAPTSTDGSARKRGRPKKLTTTSSISEPTASINETAMGGTPNNVQ
ncbi:unnamed protein product [Rotaria sp. Silwood2]|nr:unnamed protein product [Rotaria sp. Silwood2]CAF2966068.1 unnamed protein product [Rotaria sp. Silwood2]CAF3855128.1 unnamed protein product [Rotaria sp. Silwood2]CAF4123030.1 unnamed protein product [Rotaria sp. Silwood2]